MPEILRAKVKVFVELFCMRKQVARQAEEQAQRVAAEEAARRSSFLARASSLLARSLDCEALLADLARLAVPFLADLAVVSQSDEHGSHRRTEWAWTLPGGETVAQPKGAGPMLSSWLASAVGSALQSGKMKLLSQVLPGSLAAVEESGSGENAALPTMRPDFAVESALVLPLLARGKTLGVMGLALRPSLRRFSPADVCLAEDLSGRAGIALDNALLLREIREADQRKTEFLSMLAHELRNPLAPIRNGIQLLQVIGPKEPNLVQVREMIDRQTAHMARLVDDLLDVSRITRGKISLKPVTVDAAVLVESALETTRPLIDSRHHRFNVSLPSKSVWVKADPDRLAQVLANLLNNAAKYTEEGGRIDLSVQREGEEAVFRVRDSGVGIPAEMLSSIFDLFTQVDRSLTAPRAAWGSASPWFATWSRCTGVGCRQGATAPGGAASSSFACLPWPRSRHPPMGPARTACAGGPPPGVSWWWMTTSMPP